MIVPRILTRYPVRELLVDLEAAAHELGLVPSVDAVAVAWAQLVHEHARTLVEGKWCLRGCWCYNFGNRDAPASAQAAGSPVAVFVSVPEHEAHLPAPVPHVRLAYPDAYSGLCAWWASMRDRWDAIGEMDDPAAFARRLKERGYYTGPEDVYARRLAQYAHEARAMWDEMHGREPGES